MNTKVLTALVLIGIATLAALNNIQTNGVEKNIPVEPTQIIQMVQEGISSLQKQEPQQSSGKMGFYNAKASRKLTGIYQLGGAAHGNNDAPSLVLGGNLASSLANSAAATFVPGGLATSQGNAAAAILGGTGIASSNTNAAAANLGGFGIANSAGNAAAIIFGGSGVANSNTNAAAAVLGGGLAASNGNAAAAVLGGNGFANSNTNSAASTLGGLSIANSQGNAAAAVLGGHGLGGLGIANSNSNAAAANLGGFANAQGNAAAAVLGGGIANSNTNSNAAVLGGLSIAQGNSGSTAIGNNGFSGANSNTAASALGGFASGNTASSAFTAPGLSTSISNANSLAFGGNAASSSGANAASGNIGGGFGTSASNANANSAAIGSGDFSVAGSATNAASATIGGNSFSSSQSSAVAQSFGSASLNGRYLLAFPTVPVIVTRDAFIFRGCTDYRVPIIRQNRNIRYGPCEYKPTDCGYDLAFKISQRFYETSRYNRVDDGFAGYNNQGEQFFRVREKQGNRKGRQVQGYFFEGQYEAEHPSYNVEVDNNKLYFQGHKDKPVQFEYRDEGSINFNKHFEKRRDVGVQDRDRSVSDLFVSSAKVNHRGGNKGYDFQDKKGRHLASCFPKKW